MLANLDEHIYRNLMSEFQAQNSRLLTSSSYDEHKLILEAIREGDVESAASVMRDHLRKYWGLVTLEVGGIGEQNNSVTSQSADLFGSVVQLPRREEEL